MSISSWFLYFFASLVLLFFILFVPFTLRIKLHNLRDDNTIFVSVKVILFRRIPLFSLQRLWGRKKGENEDFTPEVLFKRLQGLGQGLSPGKRLRHGIVYLLRLGGALQWHELTLLLRAGTGDPAVTGLTIGVLHSLGSMLLQTLRRYWRFGKKPPLFLIYPSFLEQELKFFIAIECSAGVGRLLYSVLFPRLNKKEVTRRWQNNIPFKP
ncbi:MAG: DUF2953 domain-containing protein [Bacillota bacterium]